MPCRTTRTRLLPQRRGETRAFTLIELIVVILIIGVLSAIAVIGFRGVTDRAQVSAAQSNLRNISTSMLTEAALKSEPLSRDLALKAIGQATGGEVIDALSAAGVTVSDARTTPEEGQYAVGFDNGGVTTNTSGSRAAVLTTVQGKTYGLVMAASASAELVSLPDGATPATALGARPVTPAPDPTPAPPTLPAAPASVTAAAAPTSLRVTWGAPQQDAAYIVTAVGPDGTTAGTCTTTTSECSLTDLTPATTYTVTVTATLPSGTTSVSTPVELSTAAPVPSAPAVSVTRTSTTATFTWPAVPGATGYIVETSTNAGAAVRTTQTATSLTATVPHGTNVSVQVWATNVSGQSAAAGSATITNPLWITPTLTSGWVNYGGDMAPAGVTKTAAGVVMLQGTVRAGTAGTILTLPPGYRPAGGEIIMQQATGSMSAARVDVAPDGQVILRGTPPATWLSLDGITFIAETSTLTRTPVPMSNGWRNYGPGYAPLTVAVDSLGRAHLQGLIAGGSTAANVQMGTLPAVAASSTYLHVPSMSLDSFSHFSVHGTALIGKTPNNQAGWASIHGMYPSTTSTLTWTELPLNEWRNDADSKFAKASSALASDGVVTLQGLVRGGQYNGTVLTTLPVGQRPAKDLTFDATGGDQYATVTITASGQVKLFQGSGWLALDGINFIAEQ